MKVTFVQTQPKFSNHQKYKPLLTQMMWVFLKEPFRRYTDSGTCESVYKRQNYILKASTSKSKCKRIELLQQQYENLHEENASKLLLLELPVTSRFRGKMEEIHSPQYSNFPKDKNIAAFHPGFNGLMKRKQDQNKIQQFFKLKFTPCQSEQPLQGKKKRSTQR